MRWDFFVRHYADDAQQRRDPKCDERGVLYPRAGTLGGCNNGVTGGTFTSISRPGKTNCDKAQRSKAATVETITWKPASMGKSDVRLNGTFNSSHGTWTGTVTGGTFKGTNVTIHRAWTHSIPAFGCIGRGLKTLYFKQEAPVHI